MTTKRFTCLILAIVALAVFSGCASQGASTAAKRPKEPMPENLQFAGSFDRAPTWKFFPQTVFPPFLIQQGVSGTATIAFRITDKGYVEQAKVADASHQAFGAAAMGTVGRMVFEPARKDGKAIPTDAKVSFTFSYE